MNVTYTNSYKSPIGNITMASDGNSLTGLWFDGQRFFKDSVKEEECKDETLPVFEETISWLDTYFTGKNPDFIPSISMRTTPFRKSVWEIMCTIPYGSTMTYGEIATQIAKQKGIKKMSAQAVGNAVGHNSISLIIPCHRVIGSDGNLVGYAGGVEKKIWLLQHEGIHLVADKVALLPKNNVL